MSMTLDDIRRAAAVIAGHVVRTSAVPAPRVGGGHGLRESRSARNRNLKSQESQAKLGLSCKIDYSTDPTSSGPAGRSRYFTADYTLENDRCRRITVTRPRLRPRPQTAHIGLRFSA
jgi:hypothetical protein